jgi:hypothetical protein
MRAAACCALGLVACAGTPRSQTPAVTPETHPTSRPSITLHVEWDRRVSDEIEIYRHTTETEGGPLFTYSTTGLPAISKDGQTIAFAEREQGNGVEPSLHLVRWSVAYDGALRDDALQSMGEYQAIWRNRASPAVPAHDTGFENLQAVVETRIAEANAGLADWEGLAQCSEREQREAPECCSGPPKVPSRFHLTCGGLDVTFEPYHLHVESAGRVRFNAGVGSWGLNAARAQGFDNVDNPTFYADERRGILVVRLEHLGASVGESQGENWHVVILAP